MEECIKPWRPSRVEDVYETRGKERNWLDGGGSLKRKGREDDHGRGVRARERKIVNMVKFSASHEQGTGQGEGCLSSVSLGHRNCS